MERPVQPFTVALSDSAALNSALVGESAAWLALLKQRGFPVNAAFVITSYVFYTAPHGEITPDVEVAVEQAWQAHQFNQVMLQASVATEHPHASRYNEVIGKRENVSNINRLVIGVESIWQSSSSPIAHARYATYGLAPEEAAIAVLVQRQLPEPAIIWHANTLDGPSTESETLLQLATQIQQQIDVPVMITFRLDNNQPIITDLAFHQRS